MTGMSAATSIASGIIAEGQDKKDYERAIDMMGVPQWQSDAAWNAAVGDHGSKQIKQGFDQQFDDAEEAQLPPDTMPDMDRKEMMQNPQWQESTKKMYEAEEGKPFDKDPAHLMDWFVDEMSNFNWKVVSGNKVGGKSIPGINTSSMSYYAYRAATRGPEYARNFLDMMDNYDRLNTDWGVAGQTAQAMLTDPTNLASFGTAAAVKTIGGKIAQARLRKWMEHAIMAGAAGMVEGAVYSGGTDAVKQSVAVDAGVQDSMDYGRVAGATAIGAVGGAVLGGTAAVALPAIGRTLQSGARTAVKNARKGTGSYTPITRQYGSVGSVKNRQKKVVGEADRISTRKPWGKVTPEDTMTAPVGVDIATMDRVGKDVLLKNVTRMENDTNLRPHPDKNATPLQRAMFLRDQIVDNLLWLHDKMDPETRILSKLWYDQARKTVDSWAPKYNMTESQIAGVIAALSPEKDWYQNVSGAERMLDIFTEQQNFKPSQEMVDKGKAIYQRTAPEDMTKAKQEMSDAWDKIQSMTLSEVTDPFEAGLWIRAYDEAHNDSAYKMWSPDNGTLGFAKNKGGNDSKFAWGYPRTMGKAVQIMRDGSRETLNDALGAGHKVRNFYNNIIAPNSKGGEVTIDTHAVAAGTFEPHSGTADAVTHNLGGGSAHGDSGITGSYPIYADAYREAARRRNMLPREMQSITWEEIRTIFPDSWKNPKTRTAVSAIMKEYKNGLITLGEARDKVYEYATKGRKHLAPDWHGPHNQVHAGQEYSTYRRELSGATVPRGGSPEGSAGGVAGRRGAGNRKGDGAGVSTGKSVGAGGGVAAPTTGGGK